MTVAQVQDQVIHHSANAAAFALPALSVWLNAPFILTIVTGVLGVIWYLILIGEHIAAWHKEWKARHGKH